MNKNYLSNIKKEILIDGYNFGLIVYGAIILWSKGKKFVKFSIYNKRYTLGDNVSTILKFKVYD